MNIVTQRTDVCAAQPPPSSSLVSSHSARSMLLFSLAQIRGVTPHTPVFLKQHCSEMSGIDLGASAACQFLIA